MPEFAVAVYLVTRQSVRGIFKIKNDYFEQQKQKIIYTNL